jgi:hypothetical protein
MNSEPCRWGNRGHRNLWASLDPVESPSDDDDDDESSIDSLLVEEDELYLDEVEQQINQLLPVTITSQGYCIQCQGLIDTWPELSHRLPIKEGNNRFVAGTTNLQLRWRVARGMVAAYVRSSYMAYGKV